MSNKKILKELQELRDLGQAITKRACNAIAELERFHAPASLGVSKKRPALSPEQQEQFLRNVNKRLFRKAS